MFSGTPSSSLTAGAFASITKDGRRYTIAGGKRLGLVPHCDGRVARFCIDLDNHSGDGGNIHLSDAIVRYLGAAGIRFTCKGGKGRHCFCVLADPIGVEEFLDRAHAWGFKRRGIMRPARRGT